MGQLIAMPAQPPPSGVLVSVVAAILTAILGGVIAHGILGPLLEARGVRPWNLSDSLASIPLILLGSAMAVGCAVYLTSTFTFTSYRARVICLVLFLAGLFMVRLGILSLRKLS